MELRWTAQLCWIKLQNSIRCKVTRNCKVSLSGKDSMFPLANYLWFLRLLLHDLYLFRLVAQRKIFTGRELISMSSSGRLVEEVVEVRRHTDGWERYRGKEIWWMKCECGLNNFDIWQWQWDVRFFSPCWVLYKTDNSGELHAQQCTHGIEQAHQYI